ncbi:MAG TPA: hypothetical protein VGD84_14865, partial [Pseudonocardiaceae bacterium]
MQDALYAMCRMDVGGRVCDRTIIYQVLGWRGGDRFTATGTTDVVLVRRDPAGLVTLAADRPRITVPAALRHRCGARAGQQVLLAAFPDRDMLAIYPLGSVHHAIQHHQKLLDDGGDQ